MIEPGIHITRIPGGWRMDAQQWIPAPLDAVFTFFGDAYNLEVITPPWLRFEVLTPRPVDMRRGAVIDYRLRVRGLPLRWQSLITVWEPPHRFTDEMQRGPYRFWRHTHSFAAADGGTLASDAVEYGVPGGALVNALFVGPDVRRIFAFRQRKLDELFAADASAS